MRKTQSTSLEFPLIRNNPQVRILSILFSFPFVGWWAAVLLDFLALDRVGWQGALIMSATLTLGWLFVLWNIQRYGQGSAIIDSSELVVRTRGRTTYIPWSDVSDITLTSFADRGARGWARAINWPERKPFVEVRLSRGLREAWPRMRFGTRLKGIPLIGGDRVALYLDDPEAFVRSAKPYAMSSGE
jgi:hypothetical protein